MAREVVLRCQLSGSRLHRAFEEKLRSDNNPQAIVSNQHDDKQIQSDLETWPRTGSS